MRNGYLLTLLFFLVSGAHAQFLNSKLVSNIKVNFVPTYFFKVDPSGEAISYTLSRHSLWLYNIETQTSTAVTGEYDPVFLPHQNGNQKFVFTADQTYGLYFYKYLSANTPEYIYRDSSFRGIYESAGVLGVKSSDKFTFRVLIQTLTTAFTFKDYQYDGQSESPISEVLDSKGQLCDRPLSMAILSKDGTEAAAYDVNTSKTKIFKIVKDLSCIETDDLGRIAGKLSFSYDGRYVAYHNLSSWVYNTSGFVQLPGNSIVGNIFLFDRKMKKHIPLTSFITGTAMYPEFLANGDIIFIYYLNGIAEFYRIKPDSLQQHLN